jgi:hypothetical protein
MKKVKWLKRPEADNRVAANIYLGLLGLKPIPNKQGKIQWFPKNPEVVTNRV